MHAHDLREGFLGEIQRAISIVEDTNSIPELGLLFGGQTCASTCNRRSANVPWDLAGDIRPADRPSRLVGDHPSSDNNGLAKYISIAHLPSMSHSSLTQATPDLTIGRVDLQDTLQVLDGLGELLLVPQDAGDGIHGRDGPLVVAQGLLVRLKGAVGIAHQVGQVSYRAISSAGFIAEDRSRKIRRPSFFLAHSPICSQTASLILARC